MMVNTNKLMWDEVFGLSVDLSVFGPFCLFLCSFIKQIILSSLYVYNAVLGVHNKDTDLKQM